jgi:Arylsulfotransferase (ASST)
MGTGTAKLITRALTKVGLVLLVSLLLATFGVTFSEPTSASSSWAGTSSDTSSGGANNAVMIDITGHALNGISSSPIALSPRFKAADTDYVWYCSSGTNALTVTLSSKGSMSVGDQTGSTISVPVTVVANQAVVVTAPNGTQYWIRCLPSTFPHFKVTGAGDGGPGYYVTSTFENGQSPGYPLVLNSYGTPVWYLTGVPLSAQNTSLIPGTHTLSWDLTASYALYNLDTQTATDLVAPVAGFDEHELFYDTSGNAWVLSKPVASGFDLSGIGYPGVSKIQDCTVQELNPAGKLIWEWNASDHVSPDEAYPDLTSEFKVQGQPVVDAYHCNSIDVDPLHPNRILVSMRNVGVFLINKSTGDIIWKLGGTSVAPEGGEPVLTITGDPEGTIVGQHDARFQPDGDITAFDDQAKTDEAARGVEYSIDTATNTANMVWQYTSPWGKGSKSNMGSVRMYDSNTLPYDQAGTSYLGDHFTVINWGHGEPRPGFSVLGSANQVLMEVLFPSHSYSYRTQMVPASALNLTELRDSAGTASPVVASTKQ